LETRDYYYNTTKNSWKTWPAAYKGHLFVEPTEIPAISSALYLHGEKRRP